MALYLVPYFIVGWDVVKKCFIGIKNKQLFDESFLMTIATIGAFGCGEFGEACAVMLFYQIGEFFQGYAVGKSRGSIADLMSMAADFANREAEDGSIEVIEQEGSRMVLGVQFHPERMDDLGPLIFSILKEEAEKFHNTL
jgi:Cd2+/Zn2+-exporting ATPase